jgi:ribosomal protein L21E
MKKKKLREKGKIKFSKYFQEFGNGEAVAVVREPSINASFPQRLQGRTGIIECKRGKAYMIKINDLKKEKKILIEPIHLKKIKHFDKNDKK